MNKVVLSGRITKDPEIRTTGTGKKVCNFTVAVYGGKDTTFFINCVAWNHTAEFLGKYFEKGSPVEVEGSIQSSSYEKDGKKVYTQFVVCNNISFVPGAKKSESKQDEVLDGFAQIDSDEGLPF